MKESTFRKNVVITDLLFDDVDALFHFAISYFLIASSRHDRTAYHYWMRNFALVKSGAIAEKAGGFNQFESAVPLLVLFERIRDHLDVIEEMGDSGWEHIHLLSDGFPFAVVQAAAAQVFPRRICTLDAREIAIARSK
jgi:hypothetical protein